VKPNSIGLLTNYYKFEISLGFFFDRNWFCCL